ncbi:bifunctional lysylphosphatidylglycerol flippase/synthetase MprF [Pseudoneobacillus sp. C159]
MLSRNRIISFLKIVIPLGLLILIMSEGRKFIGDIDVALIKKHLNDLNSFQMGSILLVGSLGVSTMIFYDFVFAKRFGLAIPKTKLWQYSFTSNAMSNLLGFGGFAGAALRTYFYQKYTKDRMEILKGIAELSLFSLSGLSVLCWVYIFGFSNSVILADYRWLSFAIWGIALYLPAMLIGLLVTKRINLSQKTERIFAIKFVTISTVEWFSIFVIIYIIAMFLNLPVTFPQILSLGIVAASAGLVSMIPGGLGSFDFMMLLGLTEKGIIEEQAILLLVFYRISYYLVPFLIGMFLLIRDGWKKVDEKWNGLPTILLGQVSHLILTILVFASGVLLLMSSSFPGVIERLKFMQGFLSTPIMNLSHQLTIGVGITLLGLARGIEYRVKRAYYLAFIMLIVGAIFTLSKSFNYEEAIFVLLVAWALWISRNHFYRKNFVHTWGRMLVDLLGIFIVIGFYLIIGYANLPENPIKIPAKLREFIFTEPSDLWLSGLIGFLIALAILSIAYWIVRPERFEKKLSNADGNYIHQHLERYGGTSLSHLIYLHDKAVYWSKDEKVLFSYQTSADKLVVLGNPVGDKGAIFKAIEELRDETNQYGYTPIYYQVGQEMIPYLHENGYDFFKLGEEGFVNVQAFSLSGNKMKALRASRNKFDKDGYSFEVIEPPFSDDCMAELKTISDHWLGGRKEKGFSLGFFDPAYLSRAPIAMVRDRKGRAIAFASLMPMYDGHETFSVDLMRFVPAAPNGTMDYIFINLIEWGKQQGYKCFNLGMTPLANVGISKYSFLSEKIAAQIYRQGHVFYHFQGVRRFKEKYADHWEPKYLGYKRKTSLLFTMIQLTYLISKGK